MCLPGWRPALDPQSSDFKTTLLCAWQLLSMNTRRTKVVELSSGTHRCGCKRKFSRCLLLRCIFEQPVGCFDFATHHARDLMNSRGYNTTLQSAR